MPCSLTRMCIKWLGVVCSDITFGELVWREESLQWRDFLLGSSRRASWALQHTRPTGPHFCNLQTEQLPGLQPLVCSPLFLMHWSNHSPASCVGLFSGCWFLWDDYTLQSLQWSKQDGKHTRNSIFLKIFVELLLYCQSQGGDLHIFLNPA